MKKNGRHFRAGFTLIEAIIVISIIAILATITAASYLGVQRRAASVTMMNDLQSASVVIENHAANNKGKFPDINYLLEQFTPSKGVNLAVITAQPGEASDWPYYENLSDVQGAVLFKEICSALSSETRPDAADLLYGQGRDKDGGKRKYIWGPDTCSVYDKAEVQMNSSWGGAGGYFKAPVAESDVVDFIAAISDNNSYFPDFELVTKQYYQTTLDRFLAQGGTFPIKTFWDGDWCSPGQPWCTAKEPLPELPPSGGSSGGQLYKEGSYCVLATHQKYGTSTFFFSSETLRPQAGTCPSD